MPLQLQYVIVSTNQRHEVLQCTHELAAQVPWNATLKLW